jgi:TATA-box binding protein (TBP) (component of TFIID and TFIIIB)
MSDLIEPLRLKCDAYEAELTAAVHAVNTTERFKYTQAKPNTISISTLSAIALLNADYINLDKVAERFYDDDVQEYVSQMEQTYTVSLKPQNADHAFSNSTILKFQGYRNPIAIKIFSNGLLHITGPVSMKETTEVVRVVSFLLDVIYDQGKGSFAAHDVYVQMINTNFSTGHRLDKERLHRALRDNDMEAWIPEKHPAVRLMIPVQGRKGKNVKDKVTVLIFASGQVIITGIKTGDELLVAYKGVMDVFDRELDTILDKKRPRDEKEVVQAAAEEEEEYKEVGYTDEVLEDEPAYQFPAMTPMIT